MIRKVLILLSVATAALTLGNGPAYHSTKNVFQKQQGTKQYASVASYQSPSQEIRQQPSPYAFGYEDEGSARQESADASGKVTGSYSVTNEDGSVRVVKYVADEQGFRADIDTNEPGTKSDNPADVSFRSSAVEKLVKSAPKIYAHSKPAAAQPIQAPAAFKSASGSSGGYSYQYQSELEDGGSLGRGESGDASGKVSGYYSLSVADGRKRKVDYSADQGGFSAVVNTNEFGTKSDSPAHVTFLSSSPAQESFLSQQRSVKQPFVSKIRQVSQISENSQPSPYAFSYDAQLEDGSSSRKESADASGKVVGSYSLSVADGRRRTIDYQADQDGFRASVNTNEFGTKSDSPADIQFYSSAPQEAPAPSYSAGKINQGNQAAAFPIQQSRLSSSSQIKSVPFSSGSQFQSAQKSAVQYSAGAAADKPAPYSFNYLAQLNDGSSSRIESADASGKVVGSYSLSIEDGRQRKVDYLADQAGFRATVNTNEFGTKGDSPADVQFYSSVKEHAPSSYSSPSIRKAPHSSAASKKVEQQHLQAPIQFSLENNGAYSYNYQSQLADGGSNAHSEISEGGGKVSGFYSLSAPDGRQRKVDYTSGKGGFQASIDSNEFEAPLAPPAHIQYSSSGALRSGLSAVKQSSYSSAQSRPQSFVSQQRVEAESSYAPSPYSFGYEAEAAGGSSARNEAADASGTVTGSYTVRNEDGSVRVVDYIADKDGFRANVNTNELGTQSEQHPADVIFKSEAASQARFPARSNTPKSSFSQQKVEPWRR
ncbi:uncharacterized protein LOC118201355 isoform X2 [Stegodyphus dumicola]|uniref:uncharacterized protein LOC118201355 isoform X2 n=1 Tax=Stegodyphus dumicola TaxID=202533 RepID=UPI0015B0D9A1|nr:uncharacterized protein LOC118201355 isoform X2 [Stegodyphus dumicola]